MRALLQSSSFLVLLNFIPLAFNSLEWKKSNLTVLGLNIEFLLNCPTSELHSREGRDILLAFDADLGPAIRKACDKNFDDEAVCLARAAKIVRRDMLKLEANFTGSFDKDCQIKSVPQ